MPTLQPSVRRPHLRRPQQPSVDFAHGFVRAMLAESIATHLLATLKNHPDLTFLPVERALVQQFGASRPVIREVLAGLEKDGVIERRHGRATRMIRHLPAG